MSLQIRTVGHVPLNIFEGYDLEGIHEHKSAIEAVKAAQAIFIGEDLNNFTMHVHVYNSIN